jgi:hypothetical protein
MIDTTDFDNSQGILDSSNGGQPHWNKEGFWTPMTEDVVFDDGCDYLILYSGKPSQVGFYLTYYDESSNVFYGDDRKHYPENISHYARIPSRLKPF